jgi:hypothetical protein
MLYTDPTQMLMKLHFVSFGLLIFSSLAFADINGDCVNNLMDQGIDKTVAASNCQVGKEANTYCVATLISDGLDSTQALKNCQHGSKVDLYCVGTLLGNRVDSMTALRTCQ